MGDLASTTVQADSQRVTMGENTQHELDLDLDNALDAFDGVVVEGGVDAE